MKATIIFLSFLVLSLSTRQVYGTVHIINATGTIFSPSDLTIQLGDTILFKWVDGIHDTKSTSVPEGAAAWHEPLTGDSPEFMYIPGEIGTYDYVCTPHEAMGMVGTFIVEAPSSIQDPVLDNSFQLYPNPARQTIRLTSKERNSIRHISITDIGGKKVKDISIPKASEDMVFDISDLGTGIYFIRIESEKGTAVKKFLVQN